MNNLPPKIQRALRECRKELAAINLREHQLREENAELKRLMVSQQEDAAAAAMELARNSDMWRQECLQMQSSFSWRITGPLRLVKKVFHSLRINGLKLTLLKIVNRRK